MLLLLKIIVQFSACAIEMYCVIKDVISTSHNRSVREMDLIVVIDCCNVFVVCHDYPFGVYMSVFMILQPQFGQYDKPSSSNVLMSKSSYRSDRFTLQLLQRHSQSMSHSSPPLGVVS